MSVSRIPELSKKLADVASLGGELHVIDSAYEREQAFDAVNESISQGTTSAEELGVLLESLELIASGERLQANMIFSDATRNNSIFLTPLNDNDAAAFSIYYNEITAIVPVKIKLTQEQWDHITEPLRTRPFDPVERCDGIDALEQDAGIELLSLGETVARFEQVAGSLASTSRDIGGWYGNNLNSDDLMLAIDTGGRYHPPSRGRQQDCTCEKLNTRALISLLQQDGFLAHHFLELDDSFLATTQKVSWHTATKIHRRTCGKDTAFAVDSWVRDNGQPSDILPEEAWVAKWGGSRIR